MAFEQNSKDELERLYYAHILTRETVGKLAFAGEVTTVGPTMVVTPSAGKRLEVFWVYALTDPDASTSPSILIKLGARSIYNGYAISHSELFTGAIGESVTVTLSEAATVAVTIHYKEF